jgi:acyl-CoA synthetase (AMP-forming)/AMP-acid ligase II
MFLQFSSMQRLLIGAGSVADATVAAASSLMPNACIMSAYGMTEAASSITFDTLVPPACMHAPHALTLASRRSHVHKGKVVPTPMWLGAAQIGAIESHCVGLPAPGFQVAIEVLQEGATQGDTIHNEVAVRPNIENLCCSVLSFYPQELLLQFLIEK